MECKYEILISKFLIYELEKYLEKKELESTLLWLKSKNKIIFVTMTPKDKQNARKYHHWQDALHATLAIKGKAKYLVTRNTKDFSDFSNILEIKLPENL